MPLDALFNLTRKQLEEAYRGAGQKFIVSTRTYESTLPLFFDAVDQGVIGAAAVGVLVATEGQELDFFSYQRDQQVPGLNQSARFDDTNLTAAQRTNANEDMAIEAFSCTHRSTTILYTGGTGPTWANAKAVEAAAGGPSVIFDPNALAVPSIVHSALNNEDALMTAVMPHLFVRLKWEKREEELGCLDLVSEGGAKSYMRSMGRPTTNDRYTFKEGFQWRREGQDSKFHVVARLVRSVVLPFSLVRPQGQAAVTMPTRVALHLKFRVHGLAFGYPSGN